MNDADHESDYVTTLERRLRRLEDHESVRAVWHEYMLLLDGQGTWESISWNDIARLFAEDAVLETTGLDGGDGSWHGRDSIMNDFFGSQSPAGTPEWPRVFAGHHGTTFRIELDGDVARVTGNFFEMTGQENRLLAVGEVQTMDLKREAGSWRISRFKINVVFRVQLATVVPRTAVIGARRDNTPPVDVS